MVNMVHYTIFVLFSIYALLKLIFYAMYEIKQEQNKMGGIVIICFSVFCVALANFALFLHR